MNLITLKLIKFQQTLISKPFKTPNRTPYIAKSSIIQEAEKLKMDFPLNLHTQIHFHIFCYDMSEMIYSVAMELKY